MPTEKTIRPLPENGGPDGSLLKDKQTANERGRGKRQPLTTDRSAIQAAENEGMPVRSDRTAQ